MGWAPKVRDMQELTAMIDEQRRQENELDARIRAIHLKAMAVTAIKYETDQLDKIRHPDAKVKARKDHLFNQYIRLVNTTYFEPTRIQTVS
jgi:hypothetical protein